MKLDNRHNFFCICLTPVKHHKHQLGQLCHRQKCFLYNAGPKTYTVHKKVRGAEIPPRKQSTEEVQLIMEQMSLFDDRERTAPLASRLRPETLDEYVGQKELVGPGKILRRLRILFLRYANTFERSLGAGFLNALSGMKHHLRLLDQRGVKILLVDCSPRADRQPKVA